MAFSTMNRFARCAATALYLLVGLVAASADSPSNQIVFPRGYKPGVHYATVVRGAIREELFVDQAAIDAAKAGRSTPAAR